MQAFVFDPLNPVSHADALGMVVCEAVKVDGRRLFAKGQRLTESDLGHLASVQTSFHAVRLSPGDVHEDEAALRIARAVAGPGLDVRLPVLSRVNIVANRKGLLRIDANRIDEMNALFGIAVFSLLDRIPVLPGKVIAGAKITPVALPGETIAAVESLAASGSIMQVLPYRARRVGVLTTEGLRGTLQTKFEQTVREKMAWFGSDVIGFTHVANDPDAVVSAIEAFMAQGATLLLTGGGNTIDPLDPTISALPALGAELISFGAPAHPGSMFWLAELNGIPIVNLASCSMYSRSTIADLVLPWIMAGERVTPRDMARLGYGGLLDRDMAFRFPQYTDESTTDEDAETSSSE